MASTYIGELGPFPKTNRSAFLNFLRSKYEMYTGALEVGSYPSYLTLDPSDTCQLRCPTCPTGIENQSKRDRSKDPTLYRKDRSLLSQDLFDALIDEMGEFLFLIVFYDWGEPLLNKKLPGFIRVASAMQIETEINTNLSLRLSDDFIEELLCSGLNYIEVSIDGFTQSTYEIHRRGGNLELVKENLEKLVDTRARLNLRTSITYNFIVFSFNEHELKDAKRYARKLGINFNAREAFTDNPDWLPSYRKGEKPLHTEEELLALHTHPGQPAPHYARWSPLNTRKGSKPPSACGWHYGYSVVTAGGPVQPCCAVAHESDDFGRVSPGRTSFSDVWNNEQYRSSRAAFAGEEPEGGALIETVCSHCYFPVLMQHMYSLHDIKILARFVEVFDGVDPVLEAAFKLFGHARYGRWVNALYRRGLFHPLVQAAVLNGNQSNASAFVDFFEKHLLDELPAIPGAGRRAE